MPRIPQGPGCDCHVPVNTSEDAKLKVMETRFTEQLNEGLQIGKNFTTNKTVGNLPAGTVITEEMKVRDILYSILYSSTAATAYFYEGQVIPTTISADWPSQDIYDPSAGIVHEYEGGFKGYLGVAYPKAYGNLVKVYENYAYSANLIGDMTKTEVMFKGVVYNLYMFTEKAQLGNDTYEFLFH